MSNLPVIPNEGTVSSDMTESEVALVKKFIDQGLPRIAEITEDQMVRMLDLYLKGNTYTQIAHMLRLQRVYVLYFAYKANWEQMKVEYLNEVQEKIKNRVIESKLRSKEFILLAIQSWQQKLGDKFTAFIATSDERHLEGLDFREVNSLLKLIEMINEMDGAGQGKDGKTSPVGINLGSNGVILEKLSDNSMSVTPKDAPDMGDLLQRLADERRSKEKALLVKPIEIKKESNDEGK